MMKDEGEREDEREDEREGMESQAGARPHVQNSTSRPQDACHCSSEFLENRFYYLG